jgi:hypothetical protein
MKKLALAVGSLLAGVYFGLLFVAPDIGRSFFYSRLFAPASVPARSAVTKPPCPSAVVVWDDSGEMLAPDGPAGDGVDGVIINPTNCDVTIQFSVPTWYRVQVLSDGDFIDPRASDDVLRRLESEYGSCGNCHRRR